MPSPPGTAGNKGGCPLRGGRATWALALFVSLLLHGGVGGMLFLVERPGPSATGSDCLQVDACTLEPGEEGENFLGPATDLAAMEAVLVSASVLTQPDSVTPAEKQAQGTTASGPPAQASPPARPGSSPAPQGNATSGTRFFRIEAHGQTFVYVIDRSSSMGLGGGLRAAKEQLLASLRELPSSARFQVIVYNRSAEPLVPGHPLWMAINAESIDLVARALEGLRAEGGTDHLPALRRALALRPDVVFFLTDADDLTPQFLRAVAQLNIGQRTAIHTIELNTFHQGRPDMPMQMLAHENRGSYRAVDLESHEE